MGDVDGAMTRAFSLTLALAFVVTPAIGTAIDRVGFSRAFALVNTLLLGVPALLLARSLRAQLATCAARRGFFWRLLATVSVAEEEGVPRRDACRRRRRVLDAT